MIFGAGGAQQRAGATPVQSTVFDVSAQQQSSRRPQSARAASARQAEEELQMS